MVGGEADEEVPEEKNAARRVRRLNYGSRGWKPCCCSDVKTLLYLHNDGGQ